MESSVNNNILNIEANYIHMYMYVVNVLLCIVSYNVQSVSVLSNPSLNDCSDLTNIRLRKFSISACCFTVILICGTF